MMEYAVNHYRSRDFDDFVLVTTDHGSHVLLTRDEFSKLSEVNLDESPSLMKKLEEREILLTQENIYECFRLQRKRHDFLYRGASLHIMAVTSRCDMNCVYCQSGARGADAKGSDMSRETAKKSVDFIFKSPSKTITIEFQGGEPLLNWDVVSYVMRYAHDKARETNKNLNLALVTNLNNMDEEKMRFLIDWHVNICTSLDGPRELHDRNRPKKKGSNYDTVTYWMGRISQECERRGRKGGVSAIPTITKRSLDYPRAIVDEYASRGLTTLHLRFLHNLGAARAAWESIHYTSDEFMAFWEKALARIKELRSRGYAIAERMVDIMIRKFAEECDPGYTDLRSPCGAVISQLMYDHDGGIYSCDEGRMVGGETFRLGDVHSDTYAGVTTCDNACAVINASLNDQYICDSCAYKPFCGICPVCNYAEQGNLIGKVAESDRCSIFMKQFDWVVTHILKPQELKD